MLLMVPPQSLYIRDISFLVPLYLHVTDVQNELKHLRYMLDSNHTTVEIIKLDKDKLNSLMENVY